MGGSPEKMLFQPFDVEFIPQVAFGGDQHRIVVLQELQYPHKDGGVMAQAGEVLHKDSLGKAVFHGPHHLL